MSVLVVGLVYARWVEYLLDIITELTDMESGRTRWKWLENCMVEIYFRVHVVLLANGTRVSQ